MDRNQIKIIVMAAIILIAVAGVTLVVARLPKKPAPKIEKTEPIQKKVPVVTTAAAVKEFSVVKEAKKLLEEGERGEAVRKLENIASLNQGSEQAYRSLLLLADIYKDDANLLKAKGIYLAILNDYSEYCDYAGIQKELTSLNMKILFSPIPTKTSETYEVVPGDSLIKIAKKYSTTVDLIKKANALASDLIMPGMKLKVQKIPFAIVVDKSQSTLTLLQNDEVIKIYTVSTGKNNSTPVGAFTIKDKLIDPVWYNQGAIVPADSPENVLGTRWLGLTTPNPGYGIHGTIEPESIGYQRTEGCVRMYNTEVEELFSIVPTKTEVTIID